MSSATSTITVYGKPDCVDYARSSALLAALEVDEDLAARLGRAVPEGPTGAGARPI